ncbi:protein S100-A3 isoform X2 [Lagenorhynchus albirostris]|uniref:protein S100-A3 isoform X2 n=1 Tax=Lagenorhynchus albirostris TaxID=27610 RepID=UPI0028EAC89C|nr:protein S100-A3 isoform X2 [Lagenorhynchus albirostris]
METTHAFLAALGFFQAGGISQKDGGRGPWNGVTMAPLEPAVAAIVCTFQEYSGPCWRQVKLCQAELKELLEKELPTWTPTELWECDHNKFMSVLDTSKDCEVDFVEYTCLLACPCACCRDVRGPSPGPQPVTCRTASR